MHTVPDLSKMFGCHDWQIRSVLARGLAPQPRRLGRYRVFTPDELPAIKAALEKAGYIGNDVAVK